MKTLFDTNVILDLLLDREPYSQAAASLFSKAEAGELSGFVCATAVTTLYYLATKAVGSSRALRDIHKLLSILDVAPVNQPVLRAALEAKFADFEDAVAYAAARHAGAQSIVTRNAKDFKRAALPVYSPEEFLILLERIK